MTIREAGGFTANIAWIPSLICAALSVCAVRIGVVSIFFLAPFGFVAYGYQSPSVWFCALAAIVANAIYLAIFVPVFPLWDCLYFSVLTVVFVWSVAPAQKAYSAFLPLRSAYRFVIGCAMGAALFLLLLTGNDSGFSSFLEAQAGLLRELSLVQSGTDVVQRSIMEQYLTPEALLATLEFVALRGGALFSCFVIFLLNRQAGLVLARLIRRVRAAGGNLVGFHVDNALIWVLSCSLMTVLAGRFFAIPVVEIPGWNLLLCCALLYLAQGGGIVFHFLANRALPPFLRLGLNVLLVFLLFSPGLNIFVMGAILLLGIAENWAPLRASKTGEPPSTPGV